MTNKEKIQAMNTKQLAFFLSYFSTCDHCAFVEDDCVKKVKSREINCEKGIAEWLEADENARKEHLIDRLPE